MNNQGCFEKENIRIVSGRINNKEEGYWFPFGIDGWNFESLVWMISMKKRFNFPLKCCRKNQFRFLIKLKRQLNSPNPIKGLAGPTINFLKRSFSRLF